MEKDEIRLKWIEYCKTYPSVYEDYPFGDDSWTCMRHSMTKRTFAMIYEYDGQIWINLKCEPMQADFWRSVYPSVIPAYHMNKTHWNTVKIDGSVPDEEIFTMISDSYSLTSPKKKK